MPSSSANYRVSVGDPAPDFALPSQSGDIVHLADRIGERAVVLFFYPKDDSSGCTTEVCAFRDSHDVFAAAGAEVIGISSDSVASHAKFAGKYRLPFLLLSDRGGAVRASYGVERTLGILPGRVTYLIDRTGIVRYVFSSQLDIPKHVNETLAMLHTLDLP